MTDVFIISEANLRQFTDLNNNVDSELLKNAIREAILEGIIPNERLVALDFMFKQGEELGLKRKK